ncbi:hypothetical protein DPMN_010539 [Dreissena polymorpha]|uniref:Uncharacterized protein n=1 Tax=Dreissena polymorpha TaxID=45954 RepID=A0A9D4S147_DREPO|nr:hypothetical protein DPMN_010539 [Dreissena polymorpha]
MGKGMWEGIQRKENMSSQSKHKSIIVYSIHNEILKRVPENPNLGITLLEEMEWEIYFTNITKRARIYSWIP